MSRTTVALAAVALAACARAAAPSPDPGAGARAYASALRDDDPQTAWDLLSKQLRGELDYDAFAAAWRSATSERELQARELDEALAGEPEVTRRADVYYRDGKRVRLVHEADQWRLRAGLVTRTTAHSPLDAIEIFARAVNERDVAAALSILTARRREGINRFVTEFAAALNAHQSGDGIEYQGDNRAVLRWDDASTRYKVILVREGDEWRVDDFDIVPSAAE